MNVAIYFAITNRHIIVSILGSKLILFGYVDSGAIISSLSSRISLTLILIVTIFAFVSEKERKEWQRVH